MYCMLKEMIKVQSLFPEGSREQGHDSINLKTPYNHQDYHDSLGYAIKMREITCIA